MFEAERRSTRPEIEGDAIVRILDIARAHLRMDGALLAEIDAGEAAARYTAGSGPFPPTSRAIASIVELAHAGIAGAVVSDTTLEPGLAAVAESGIRSLVALPVPLSGSAGALVCVSRSPDETLRETDAGIVRVLARAVATLLERGSGATRGAAIEPGRIRDALQAGPAMVFQPIVDLQSERTVGYEALARFDGDAERRPERWFADAARVDLGRALEIAAVKAAVRHFDQIPRDAFLSVNASTRTAATREFYALLEAIPAQRLVVELTDHASIEDDHALGRALATLGAAGVRIATDVSDAGFESLSHLLQLAPDVIKIDGLLVRGVETDPVRRTLARTIVAFATEMGATVTGEMIESDAEGAMLRALGVAHGQGNWYGLPGPLPAESA